MEYGEYYEDYAGECCICRSRGRTVVVWLEAAEKYQERCHGCFGYIKPERLVRLFTGEVVWLSR